MGLTASGLLEGNSGTSWTTEHKASELRQLPPLTTVQLRDSTCCEHAWGALLQKVDKCSSWLFPQYLTTRIRQIPLPFPVAATWFLGRRPLQEVRDSLYQEISVFQIGKEEGHFTFSADGQRAGQDAGTICFLNYCHLEDKHKGPFGSIGFPIIYKVLHGRRERPVVHVQLRNPHLSEGNDEMTGLLSLAGKTDVIVGNEHLARNMHLVEWRPQGTVCMSIQAFILG